MQQSQPQKKSTIINPMPKEDQDKLKDLIGRMVKSVYTDQPEDLITYLFDFLKKEKNYGPSGLTIEETNELDELREKATMYRGLEEHYKNKAAPQPGSAPVKVSNPPQPVIEEPLSDEDDERDINPELDDIENIKKIRGEITHPGHRDALYTEPCDLDPEITKKEPKKFEKNENIYDLIKGRLCSNYLFNCFDEEGLLHVIGAMEEKKFNPGQQIFKQNEINDNFYFLYTGKLECFRKPSKEIGELLMKVVLPNEYFGEINLIFPSKNTITARAKVESIIYVLNRADYNLVKQKTYLQSKEHYLNCLKKVEILKELKDEDMSRLPELVSKGNYNKGDIIFKEGQSGNILYIIVDGEVVGMKYLEPGKKGEQVKVYKPGDFIDDLSLLYGVVRNQSLVANSENVNMIAIDLPTIKKEFGDPTMIFKNRHEEEQEKRRKREMEYMKRLYELRNRRKKKKKDKQIDEQQQIELEGDEYAPLSSGGVRPIEGNVQKEGENENSFSDVSFDYEGGEKRKEKQIEISKEEIKEERPEQQKEGGESILKTDKHQFPKATIEEIGDKDGNTKPLGENKDGNSKPLEENNNQVNNNPPSQ